MCQTLFGLADPERPILSMTPPEAEAPAPLLDFRFSLDHYEICVRYYADGMGVQAGADEYLTPGDGGGAVLLRVERS